jgi:hypothetical protein
MLRLAARARVSWPGVLLLTAIALVPWAEHHQRGATRSGPTGACDRIAMDPWGLQYVPLDTSIIVPPPHPDAKPWPYGMVIGMGTPSVDPGIVLWNGSPLANVMSVFLAPWSALAGLLGA